MSAPTTSVSIMSSQTSANTAAHKTHKQLPRPPFECIALLLQGGGALGAYQAGVYEALSEAHLAPDWVARRTDVNDPGPAKQQFVSYPVRMPQLRRHGVISMQLRDKVAVITGAASGIGKEIARSFAEAVAIADRNAAAADELRGAGTRSLGIGHGCHE